MILSSCSCYREPKFVLSGTAARGGALSASVRAIGNPFSCQNRSHLLEPQFGHSCPAADARWHSSAPEIAVGFCLILSSRTLYHLIFISLVIHNNICFVLFTVKAYKYLYNKDNILQFVPKKERSGYPPQLSKTSTSASTGTGESSSEPTRLIIPSSREAISWARASGASRISSS